MGLKYCNLAIILQITILFACLISFCGATDDYSGANTSNGSIPSFSYEINNLLIHTLSKERKREDGESMESWLASVVEDILFKSGIRGVIVGSRIINVFKKKIYTLQSTFNRAKRSGGKSLTRLINVWDVGPKYRFTIYYNEVNVVNLKQENNKLKGEKRKLEETLEEECEKRLRAEEKVDSYKHRFKQLVRKVAKLSSNKKGRGPQKEKAFTEYSARQQKRIRNTLKEQCTTTLSFFGHYNFFPSKIEFYNCETGLLENITLIDDNEWPLFDIDNDVTQLPISEVDNMNMWLYIKDRFNISNEAWHELAMKSGDQPCLYKIIKHMKSINKKWDLKSTPGEKDGVQISFKESITEHIERLRNGKVIQNGDTIKIKLSGDGTNIGKRLKVVNITYTILNENKIAMSEKENYLLAILRTGEDYETLAEGLSDLIKEMELLDKICVGDETFTIEYFLGGDWKFLACVTGIGAANADHACIWCTIGKV